jgi:asparagine synthase (glutamine-hydrolysing)
MCGIAGGWGDPDERGVAALHHRGPDARALVADPGAPWLGHTRLAILDLDSRSDQPFRRGGVLLAYNGELWNFRELRAALEQEGETFATSGDTEVVAAALDRWGAAALERFDGQFALAWTAGDRSRLYLARDRFGEVPLHASLARPFRFASELKALRAMGAPAASFTDVGPGEVWTVTPTRIEERRRWYVPPIDPSPLTRAAAAPLVREALAAGATRRAIADVPVCALLSGGLDSAAIVHELKAVMPSLVAYVAVMDPRSPDLAAARAVAAAEGVELREVTVTPPTADDLGGVIEAIEMPYKAQVEIAWACLALADRMAADGFKVTFSGEGSDELWASYGFAYHALLTRGWHSYRRDLILEQGRKNFARCNKVFMSRGVECRLPFLERPRVELALSLRRPVVETRSGRTGGANQRGSKTVLRDAYRGRVVSEVVDRPKLAFQDGLGMREAAAASVPDPRRFYGSEFSRRFGGVAPDE